MTDVLVGLGIDDDGTLGRYLAQVKQLDKSISEALTKNAELGNLVKGKITTSLSKEITGQLKELKNVQEAIRAYTRDQFSQKVTNQKLTPGTDSYNVLQARYEAFLKSLGKLDKEYERQLLENQRRAELAQKRRQKQADNDLVQSARNNRNIRLSKINNRDDLTGLSVTDARQLAGQARYMAKQENARGLASAKKSEERLNLLTNFLREQAKPGILQRQNTIEGLVGSKKKLKAFLQEATPEMLRELSTTSRRMSRTAFDAGDTGRGESLGQLAGQFKTALSQMAPTFLRVQAVTKDLLSPKGTILRSISRENIEQAQQQAGILRRQLNRAVASDDQKNAPRYQEALTRLQNQIATVKDAPRLRQVQRLGPLSTLQGSELNNRLDGLLGANPPRAQLEAFSKVAQSEANRLKTLQDFNAAEGWKRVEDRLKELIGIENKKIKPETERSVRQMQSQLDDAKVKEFARNAYDGRALNKSSDVLGRMSAVDLEGLKRQGELRLRAQQFRADSATGTQKVEEERLLRLLKEQLAVLQKQLGIRNQIDTNNAKRSNVELNQLQREEQARKAAERNSPEANRTRVAQNIEQSRLRREMDGGAEMFRNQMMLLRNYAVMGAGVGGAYSTGSFVLGLDTSFKQLQSILALTNNDMAKLKGELIAVSELTKFDALEVVDTSIILGQAGLNKEQIVRSIEGITLFATAVGTDLKSAVDLATSALGVYNIEATRMPEIVDKLTISINKSKLNLDKLSLGIQYAGNIAEQSNVSFEDTVAALAAMANSGVKSGSTLGTGLRQILITLQKPSDGFKKKMRELNIEMSSLDLKTHSLTDVMATLAQGGFTVVDAMQTMEVRAAAAFGAYANNIETARDITKQMQESGAASQANAVQMEALANQWARFSSVAKSIFYDALEPMVDFLSVALKNTTDWLTALKDSGDMVQYIVSGLVTLLALKTTLGVVNLGGRLASGAFSAIGGGAAGSAGAAVGGAAAGAASAAATRAASTTAVMAIVRTLLAGPWIWGIAGAGALASGIYSSLKNDRRLSDPLDRAKFESGAIDARLARNEMGVNDVTDSIGLAYYRKTTFDDSAQGMERLSVFIGDLNAKLRSVGFYMDPTTTSFDSLIEKLQETRTQLLEFKNIDLVKKASAGIDVAVATQNQFKNSRSTIPFSGAENSRDELQTRVTNFGRNTRAFKNANATNRQLRAFEQAAPELAGVFVGTGRDSEGTFKKSPYENLLDEVKGLDVKSTSSEQYQKYQSQLQDMLSKIALAKGKDLVEISNRVGLPEDELKDVLNTIEQDILRNLTALQGISASLKPMEDYKTEKASGTIKASILEQFELPTAQLISELDQQSKALANSPKVQSDALAGYRDFQTFKQNSTSQVISMMRQMEEEIKRQIEADPNLSFEQDFTRLSNQTPLFRDLQGLLGRFASIDTELKPGAAKALKRQTDYSRDAAKDMIDSEQSLLSDANNEGDINAITNRILTLERQQYEQERELAQLTAVDDETRRQSLESLEEGYRARVVKIQQEQFKLLTKFYAKDDLAQGLLTGSTTSKAESRAMLAAIREDAKADAAAERATFNSTQPRYNELRGEAQLLNDKARQAQRNNRTQSDVDNAKRLISEAALKSNEAIDFRIDALNELGSSKAARIATYQKMLEQEAAPEVKSLIEALLNTLVAELPKIEADIRNLDSRSDRVNFKADATATNTQFRFDSRSDPNTRRMNADMAKALRDEQRRASSEAEELLRQRQTEAERIRNNAEELKRVADESLAAARDPGLPEEQQLRNLTLASVAMQRAGDAMNAFIQAQKDALTLDLEGKRQRLANVETSLQNPNLPAESRRVFESVVNTLKPDIAQGEKELEGFDRQISENTFETKKQTDEIRGNTEQLRLAGRRFLTEDRRRMTAVINGGTYQTDAQVARGKGELTSAGTMQGGFGTKVSNGLLNVFEDSYKAYEGIDAMTESMIGFKEILSGTGDQAGSFFAQFANGSLRAGDAFRGFGVSVLQSMTEMASKLATNILMQQVLMFAISAFGGATSGPMAGGPNLNSGAITAWRGGPVPAPRRFNNGGLITSGLRTRDSTLINAAQGEFVLRQAAVDAIGLEGVEALNALDKNTVNSLEKVNSSKRESKMEGDKIVNVWVVSEEEAQQQGMTDQSILVVVDKALMKNSSTKKLVKRISLGEI